MRVHYLDCCFNDLGLGMKITFVCPHPNMSGGIRVVAIYAEWLSRRGHDVTVVCPSQRHHMGRLQRWRHALAVRLGRASLREKSHFDGLPVDVRVLAEPRPVRDADLPDADVVIATWWETAEWVGGYSARAGRKYYLVQHHEVFDYLPVPRVQATYRAPLQKIVIAEWLRKVMRDEYGDTAVHCVPNAVDHDQFHAPVRTQQAVPTVGVLFNEVPFKGLDVALAALALVRERLPALRVIAFGSHPPSRLPAGFESMTLTIDPPQHQIRSLYADCDVWLTCSRSEGFNLPAMEAMACRTPVVATRTGWPAEAIVDGVNGHLVEVDDVPGTATRLFEVLTLDPESWARLSQRAYDTVKDSSWERSARLFEAALAPRARSAALSSTASLPNTTASTT